MLDERGGALVLAGRVAVQPPHVVRLRRRPSSTCAVSRLVAEPPGPRATTYEAHHASNSDTHRRRRSDRWLAWPPLLCRWLSFSPPLLLGEWLGWANRFGGFLARAGTKICGGKGAAGPPTSYPCADPEGRERRQVSMERAPGSWTRTLFLRTTTVSSTQSACVGKNIFGHVTPKKHLYVIARQ